MQYDVKTVDEYLKALEDDWRKEKLLLVRDLILKDRGTLEESIRYKMLNYGTGEDYVCALNAQKHYVSFYVGNIAAVPGHETLLKGFDYGKGCIRIRKTLDVANSGLPTFITTFLKLWEMGVDGSCS